MVNSEESLPEDLQNYEVPMVVVGYDIVSLYPSMKIEPVVEKVRQAIIKSDMKWMSYPTSHIFLEHTH